ncbi:MAG: class I SAM-dependent methyltransferase [Clostridia bacterium]|nr:class I SAM-dependent methyltransferase [Clostridia bacterium]
MGNNVCPWWLGYMLLNPLRKLIQNPDHILNRYIKQNMKVMDIGCAMGFFSLPLARLVGEQGKVICVDMQEKMIEVLLRRAVRKGLNNRLEVRICKHNSLMVNDLVNEMDFILAFAVVHEVRDKDRLFEEIRLISKSGGCLLIAEPIGHVSEKDFTSSVELAEKAGFSVVERPVIGRSNAVLLRKHK